MKIPQAVAIRVVGGKEGGVTLILIDAQNQPIGEANPMRRGLLGHGSHGDAH